MLMAGVPEAGTQSSSPPSSKLDTKAKPPLVAPAGACLGRLAAERAAPWFPEVGADPAVKEPAVNANGIETISKNRKTDATLVDLGMNTQRTLMGT